VCYLFGPPSLHIQNIVTFSNPVFLGTTQRVELVHRVAGEPRLVGSLPDRRPARRRRRYWNEQRLVGVLRQPGLAVVEVIHAVARLVAVLAVRRIVFRGFRNLAVGANFGGGITDPVITPADINVTSSFLLLFSSQLHRSHLELNHNYNYVL